MLRSALTRLKSFRDETEGTVAVEAAIVFPFIMWAFLAMFVYFDAYRQTSLNHKAANTIADMLSRETQNINAAYIDNAKGLFHMMSQARDTTKIRLSVVKWDDTHDAFRVIWSQRRGSGISPLAHDDITEWANKLPSVPNQERVILVETWTEYISPFSIGMPDSDIKTFVFTRLRFAPQLKYDNG